MFLFEALLTTILKATIFGCCFKFDGDVFNTFFLKFSANSFFQFDYFNLRLKDF